jgi:hypothetical protein
MPFLSYSQRARLLLLCGCIACFLLFWEAGHLFRIPVYAHREVSLLLGSAPLVDLLVVMVVLVVSVLIGTLVAGTIRFDAGLFCATAGLIALTARGGTMGDVLRQYADRATMQPNAFLVLATELVILFAIVALAWSALWLLHRGDWLQGDAFRDGVEDVVDPLSQRIWALAMQAAVMAIVVLLLCQTDAKKQVLASVFIGAFIGSISAYAVFPVRPSIWYWAGPGLVGVVGYLWAFKSPGAWQIGHPDVALARPLPLDYASIGPAGAILGYWMSRRWQRGREEEAEGTAGED